MTTLQPGQHIHLVGIGGTGLSAIARVLMERGYRVSGSDRALNAMTDALARDGAHISAGHEAANIAGADALLISSAIKDDNPEVQAARAAGIPVYKRVNFLADLLRDQRVIGIAGSHGKTTTAAMVAHTLLRCGRRTGYIVGGVLPTTGTNGAAGDDDLFVIEADEYDYMFLSLRPTVAVVTNVEWDHPDFFATPRQFTEAFERFADRIVPAGGVLIACGDDAGARALAERQRSQGKRALLYGMSADYETSAGEVRLFPEGAHFNARIGSHPLVEVRLAIPGARNVLNALAALSACAEVGLLPAEAASALETFTGAGRRFEIRADVDGIAVVDDYAHHPTAIRATIAAARTRYPDRTLWAVWQPHTYTRTRALLADYQGAFGEADHVLVTDIYAAREAPIEGVTGAAVVAGMEHPRARHVSALSDAAHLLAAEVKSPAVVLIMSAGDAYQIGIDFLRLRGLIPS